MEEVWKTIDGYEDYQVSNFGMVKSLKFGNERVLKPTKDSGGYLMVILCKNGKPKAFKVHQLVVMAFLGHIPDGSNKICVDHKNNIKTDNMADNLQLISNRENLSKDRKGYSSEFVGVSWYAAVNKWMAQIQFNDRRIHLGYFELEVDASNAYKKALKEWEQGLNLNVLYPKRVLTSQYIGVSLDKNTGKWVARYKGKHIGRFRTELEAYEARENYIKQLQTIF